MSGATASMEHSSFWEIVMIFWLRQLRAICFPRIDSEFLWKKVSKIFDIFFRSREANFLPKFRRTREETRAEQTASRGILLSSSSRAV